MPYVPLVELLPDLAKAETRTITVLPGSDAPVPPGNYSFVELYCNEPGCDCRRVFFNVISHKRGKVVAVIAYGWETSAFYARWYRQNDPQIIREMQGPILNPGSQQSELAPALLKLVRGTLLKDREYIERLKRHYWMFKGEVDPKHFKDISISRQENDPNGKTRKRHRPRS